MKKICIALITIFISCSNDDDTAPNCGCDSETVHTISDTDNFIGEISYKTQIDPQDDYYNNKFWIGYTEENCSNCIHHTIICNESFLKNDFDDIKETGEIVEVKFSGYLKEVCNKSFNPADYTFERIGLTSIEKQ